MSAESRPDVTPVADTLTRRSLLRYVGYGAASLAAGHALGPLESAARAAAASLPAAALNGPFATSGTEPGWAPVGYPLPLPNDGGSAATDASRFATFDPKDAITLPAGFRTTVVARWGDTFGPAGKKVRFGYACDYTGLVPIKGSADEFWLIVNHEYISGRPWLQGWDQVLAAEHGKCPVSADGKLGGAPLLGMKVDLLDEKARAALPPERLAGIRAVCRAAMDDLGVAVLRVRRKDDETFAVVADSADHFRIHGLPASNRAMIDAGAFRFSGPAAGLMGVPTGTFANCSGETTPWGTFLTCEENFQDQVPPHVTPAGLPLPGDRKDFQGMGEPIGDEPGTKLPFEFEGLGTGIEPPLDGRQCGWVCEVDPVKRTMIKHTALGRFRHENVAVRAEAGKRLAAYLGDDRRGGHVWKFVSDGVVADPHDPANSKLLEKGTLYAARFEKPAKNGDHLGRWVALTPSTPLVMPDPATTADGVLCLPYRPDGGHVLVGSPTAKTAQMSVRRWAASIERFAGKPFNRLTLGDLVAPGSDARAVILTDAFAMATAAGGTPCARPEDIEVHPVDKSVYVSFTDATGSEDGSPDARIFPDSARTSSRQYGAIYRLVEDHDDPASMTFKWGKLVASGELADGGGGFVCADNLAFDPAGNLWVVCDITTPAHNFAVTRSAEDRTTPGDKNFMGLFGNNAMFMIPTTGPAAGVPRCFAVGPTECEFTGPTFTPDGRSLLLSVQHPGELYGTRGKGPAQRDYEVRKFKVAARDGKIFEQTRKVPLGSNFPSAELGTVPRPCVVCVTKE